MKTALSIAGSDCSGGAGIQADLKTMTMNGVYAMSAITALTAQNTTGVTGISEVSPDFLKQQIDAVFTDIFPDAVKIGMVSSTGLIRVIAGRLRFHGAKNIVVDPVMVATSGSALLKNDAVEALETELLSIAAVATPNIPEAEILTKKTISEKADILEAGSLLLDKVPGAVLIKGGHLPKAITVTDYLFVKGEEPKALSQAYVATENNHGTGCTLSAAIATHLGQGLPLLAAVTRAQQFLNQALRQSYNPGHGAGPVNHACRLLRESS